MCSSDLAQEQRGVDEQRRRQNQTKQDVLEQALPKLAALARLLAAGGLAASKGSRGRSSQGRYPIADAIEKMGMYIAMTKPPTTTPRNNMIMGSIIEVRFSTDWSTSSS